MDAGIQLNLATLSVAPMGGVTMPVISKSATKSSWRLVVLGLLVISMLTASYQLMVRYIAQQSETLEQKRAADMQWVLVFSRDIEADEVLRLEDLQQRKFPPNYISDDWLRPHDAMAVVGNRLRSFVGAGEPVVLNYLQTARQQSFSDVLKAGEYAVTATVGIEQVHHGLVAAGNQVSLVAQEAHTDTQSILANIEILALDNADNQAHASNLPVTITFRMNAAQALRFEAMRRSGFALWLQHPEVHYVTPKPAIKPKVFVINSRELTIQ